MNGSFRAFGGRRYRIRRVPRQGWPHATALIDIFFLGMLFLTISSKTTRLSGIRIDLPREKKATVTQIERYVISLAATPGEEKVRIYFQDHPVDSRKLAEALSQLKSLSRNATVIIRADRAIPYEKVLDVINLSQSAGVASFLAVDPREERSETRFDQ
ncbi:MAG: biopolymer transporter ExbD [Victivallaceae bacterium]|nr:biopolymer transporter ExbD [Victivallaceae bacterium]